MLVVLPNACMKRPQASHCMTPHSHERPTARCHAPTGLEVRHAPGLSVLPLLHHIVRSLPSIQDGAPRGGLTAPLPKSCPRF